MKLGPSELHVWLAFDRQLAARPLVEAFAALLDAGERERAERFRSDEHAHQFLVTRALQRSVLSCYAPQTAPADWRFVAGERGKPELAPEFAGYGLRFNISHTASLVVMAITRAHSVGVDVECLDARAAPLALATRYFTSSEARQLAGLPATEQQRHFYRLWTLKEAWLKATGTGVAEGLAGVSFDFDAAGQVGRVTMPVDDHSYWQFWQGQPSEQHLMAIAAGNPWSPLTLSVFRRLPAAALEFESQPALPLVADTSGQEQRPQA
ncbi:MAG TPA: 4'-phosphopantetheinyl transferase superfamily protein [Steroidobacteraceae bacterium]|nr:4'-phosphopantetheinyl transferase superfamily protein [Steroidobacteraceae bacterium]